MPIILAGDFNDLPNSKTLNLIENKGFTDVRKVDLLSKDINTPTHYTIIDYITITEVKTCNLKKYVVQGSFDVLEKQELPDTAIASDHRPVSVQFKFN